MAAKDFGNDEVDETDFEGETVLEAGNTFFEDELFFGIDVIVEWCFEDWIALLMPDFAAKRSVSTCFPPWLTLLPSSFTGFSFSFLIE